MNIPKVSICIVTYNQKDYISECLDSIINQSFDFCYEIIVGDDFSTDGTRELIEEFAIAHPGKVVKNFQNENVGFFKNTLTTYGKARGEYICHIDGDDGALPNKLQYSAQILDENSDCVMVTHDMIVKDKYSNVDRLSLKKMPPGIYKIEDFIFNFPFFANSSKMVRREACIDSIKLLKDNAIDVELHILECRYGYIYHIDKPLGFYREFVGISSVKKRVNPLIAEAYGRVFEERLLSGFIPTSLSDSQIKQMYAKSLMNFAYQSLYFGRGDDARFFIKKSLSQSLYSFLQPIVYIAAILGPISYYLVRLRFRFMNKYRK
jgi:glycosyltransferase involved in cell wall biosynthesis